MNQLGKKLLFIDTETTGLPKDYNAYPTSAENWPRIVSFAYILTDLSCQIIDEGSFIVKPSQFLIPSEATKVHGISTSDALSSGIELKDALSKIKNLCNISDIIVGHNVLFDINVIDAEFYRSSSECPLSTKPYICTMKSSAKQCNLPNGKFPKLMELYNILFGKDFQGAHDAMSDTKATFDCFWLLVRTKIISLFSPTDIGRIYWDAPKSWFDVFKNLDFQNKQTIGSYARYIFVCNYMLNRDFFDRKNNILMCRQIVDYTNPSFYFLKCKIDEIPSDEKKKESQYKFLAQCVQFNDVELKKCGLKEYTNKYNIELKKKKDKIPQLTLPELGVRYLGFDNNLVKAFAFLASMSSSKQCTQMQPTDIEHVYDYLQDLIKKQNVILYKQYEEMSATLAKVAENIKRVEPLLENKVNRDPLKEAIKKRDLEDLQVYFWLAAIGIIAFVLAKIFS